MKVPCSSRRVRSRLKLQDASFAVVSMTNRGAKENMVPLPLISQLAITGQKYQNWLFCKILLLQANNKEPVRIIDFGKLDFWFYYLLSTNVQCFQNINHERVKNPKFILF